ncbi:helix-turn-helix transcriptional regulator [Streptomyces gamaensis]|uniref:Helix-turn-helix transcriptional regulator n=1 Tax=Streptomyces gamaensis TaxID=1763542 RepID=A0ABW0Z4J4_9ACTN
MELAEILRSRRTRVTPREAGLSVIAGRRRTTGLRREEVATLAGVSIEYYRRLEQGKQNRPGLAVLRRTAEVLRLDEDERQHLYTLGRAASASPDDSGTARPSAAVRTEVLRMLDIMRPYPACVLGRAGDLLAANPAGLRLFPGIEDMPEGRRNTARYTFLDPAARELYRNWEDVATGVVAHLRATADAHPGAADVMEVVDELSEHSAEFADLWQRYDVRVRTNGRKLYRHPDVGRMTLTYEAYAVARSDGHRLIVYQAEPGTPDHDAMLLLSLGRPD